MLGGRDRPSAADGSCFTTAPDSASEPEPAVDLGTIDHHYYPNWSCPVPPKENRLKVAIRAGEKVFEDDGHR